uniref:Uncharacterized protein n=1 Tax=Lotus japonicus TaxID=34305 RepID=I3SBF9_LOTJA|nr:unknown [Lotus japonicus]
MSSFRTSGQPG